MGLFVYNLFQEYFFSVAIIVALKFMSNNDLEKYIPCDRSLLVLQAGSVFYQNKFDFHLAGWIERTK